MRLIINFSLIIYLTTMVLMDMNHINKLFRRENRLVNANVIFENKLLNKLIDNRNKLLALLFFLQYDENYRS